MKAISPEAMPQVIMMRASHHFALNRSAINAPGISQRKYPTKKIPAPNPKTSFENCRSAFIVRAAYPRLTRSRYAMIDVMNNGSTMFK